MDGLHSPGILTLGDSTWENHGLGESLMKNNNLMIFIIKAINLVRRL